MKLVIALAGLAALGIVYIYWLRPYLRALPQIGDLIASHDTFFDAAKAWLDGRKTIIVGLWGSVIAWAPDFLQAVAGFDLMTLLHLPQTTSDYIKALVPVLMMIFRSMSTRD